jgi:hypothetical protein
VITNNTHVAEDIIMITDEISERLRATVLSWLPRCARKDTGFLC